MNGIPIIRSSIKVINKLKRQLSKQFEIKDFGAIKQIIGMRIVKDRANGILNLSQKEFVLYKHNMDGAKPVNTTLVSHVRLTKKQSPKMDKEKNYMN